MRRFFLAALLVFLAGAMLAGPRTQRGHGHHRYDDLNLTDAQRAQIEQLRSQFRAANETAFDAAREAGRAYREAKRAGDTAKMAALKPAVDAKRAELRRIREAQQAQIRAVLTPEQQAKLRKPHRGGRRNHED